MRDSYRGRMRCRRRNIAALTSAVLASGLLGCASDVAHPEPAGRIEFAPTPAAVLSGQPTRDAVTFAELQRQLTAADWAKLDQLGPRPIWEQLEGRKKLPVAPVAPASSQPAVAEARDLPFELSELVDGKLRIIWKPRSYGGSTVGSVTDGGTSRRKITAAPGDLAPLVAALTPYVGAGGSVLPLPRENRLIINCDATAKASVLDLLDKLDVPPRQVEITARIFEVNHDFDFQQGAQVILRRLATDSSQQAISSFNTQRFLDSVGNLPFQGSVLQLMKVFQDAGVTLDASFQLLADEGIIKVVSSPRMTVSEGQTGYMLAGQELPIQSSTITGTTTLMSTSYKPVGVQLYITPQVVSEAQIKLHMISIVSAVSGFAPLPMIGGGHRAPESLVNPIIDSREAETAVTIPDRSTLVISGLRTVRTTIRENKVPGLGDLPALGWLFKNHRSQQQVTDLYFFVTPMLL